MGQFCANCGRALPARKKNPNQCFCSDPDCQRARKRQWQKDKMRSDTAYRENQRQANKDWQRKHPLYWREYRQKNKDYAQRNRKSSKQRMFVRRQVIAFLKKFAKMDASLLEKYCHSGYFGLIPLGEMFAKMDVKILKISIPQLDTDQEDHVCKDRTVSPPCS